MVKRLQARGPNVLAKRSRFFEHFGCIADQTQAGRGHEKRHRDQEPPVVIDMPNREFVEDIEPERTKLIDITVGGTALGNDRTNDASQTDINQQANRKAHRTQELDEISQWS